MAQVLVRLARHLLRLMALALGMPRAFFDALTTAPVSTLRLLHYWPLQNFKKEIGCGAHTDYGLVTLLLQDDVGGLQVLNQSKKNSNGADGGEWIHVPPIEGALVVNIGDMMHRWTQGVFKSTIHRVVNTANVDRYSCPFFFNPNIDAQIVPISTLKAMAAVASNEKEGGDGDSNSNNSGDNSGSGSSLALTCGEILKEFYRRAGLLDDRTRSSR